MHYPKPLNNFRSLRYLFLLLTLGVVVVALATTDSSVPTQAALQPPTQQRTQPAPKTGLPNYDIRLAGKTGFDDFDLTSTPGRARAQQTAHVRARLTAVDQFLNARPDVKDNLRAIANEAGAMKNLFIEGGTLSEPESDTPDNSARNFLNRHSDLFAIKAADSASLKLMKEDNDEGTVFLDYTQTVDGIKVFQGQVQVVVNNNGEVLSVREGFLVDDQQVRLRPRLSEAEGVAKAFEHAGKTVAGPFVETHTRGSQAEMSRFANPLDPEFQEVLSELNVVRVGDASRLAWHVYVNVGPADAYEILVDAHNGELLLRNNLVSDAQGTVYTRSPNRGPRQLVFFPNSWLGTSVVSTGNNADACIDADHNAVCDPTSGNGLLNGRANAPNQDFSFPFSPADDPRLYPAHVVTNLFYFMNVMHDFSFNLGFTTTSGNMEGNDRVLALAQSVDDNAFFFCAPEGSSPLIRMGIFTPPTPDRDSSVDSDVAFHEYGHGIANRLIGNCSSLGGTQSDALDEGWADYFAITLGGDGAVGEYVAANSIGLRRAIYSVPAAAVHDSYADLGAGGFFESHNDGEIWAATLWDLRAQLGAATVDRLVVQGMKFTPATGTSFLNARDGILQADQNLTGGGNRCTIWTVFARHGMGFSATGNDGTTHNAAFDVPSSCAALPPVYEGYVDGTDCNQIWGWAWDQNKPNTPINVDIYANNSYIATAAANQFRQDLFNAGKGNGYHAFAFVVPSYLKNGQLQNISVKFGGTSTQLIWSPRPITCSASMFPSDVPQTTASGGGLTWEQGVEFSSSISGKITRVRFWKASGEPSGNHVGRIWTANGNLLATASFFNETASGWQTAAVSPALQITAGTRYKVTYNVHSVVAKTFDVFANGPLNRPPFTIYGSSYCSPAGCFPSTGSTSNLFADIVFNSPQ